MRSTICNLLASAAFLASAAGAHAQSVATVHISPAHPRAGETVYAVYTSPQPCQVHVQLPGDVRLANNTFTIRYRLRDNLTDACDNEVRTVTELGQLPAGDFQVVALFDALPSPPFSLPAASTRAETAFSVLPRAEALRPVNNVSGMWYDSGDPGWALTLYQQGDNRLLGTWATYDVAGRPTWFLLLPGQWVELGVYEAPIAEATGGPFFARPNPVQPDPPDVRVVGTARLLFNASAPVEAGGQFTYTVNGFTTSRPLRYFRY